MTNICRYCGHLITWEEGEWLTPFPEGKRWKAEYERLRVLSKVCIRDGYLIERWKHAPMPREEIEASLRGVIHEMCL